MIEIKGISKIYKRAGNETKALDGIDLQFEDKGVVFVLGQSGSGKTTLLNLIGALDEASDGTIVVNGVDIKNCSNIEKNKYRNQQLGFVFQNSQMIEYLNVLENVTMPLNLTKLSNKEKKERGIDLLKELGVYEIRNKKVNQISGGQKQRVAIARSLINNPDIILADEPTGALDSDNSKVVMDIFSKIGKNRLVIIVSHNEELARQYANRIIKLHDGKIIEDSKNNIINENVDKEPEKSFKRFSLLSSFRLAVKSLYNKKFRTIFTILALMIGVISTGLVILISNSMNSYSVYAQRQALINYPITLSSNVREATISKDAEKYPQYPSDDTIKVINVYGSYYKHINVFSNEYLEYLNNMPNELYQIIDYGSTLNINMISYTPSKGYQYLGASSYIVMINDSSIYLSEEYDLLYGDHYPSSMNELALVVDSSNCIDAYVLNYLGIEYKDITEYSFEDMCKNEYKVVRNNDYYYYDDVHDIYRTNNDIESLYNNSEITLKISCILRAKPSADMRVYSTGLLYTHALFEYMHNDAVESDIVKAQLEYGLDKNVFTGKPYTETATDFYSYSKEYYYENNLRALGYLYKISYIKIYTENFENRSKINSYLQAYNEGKDFDDQVIYKDYMGSVAEEIARYIKILMTVLLCFSLVSLIVSSIMIALLMYVSVIERIREIGLIRNFGCSQFNVGMMFLSEGGFIGLISGLLGVIGATLLVKPILRMLSNIVQGGSFAKYNLADITETNVGFYGYVVLILGSVVIAILASLVPAIVAAKKKPVEAINYRAE